MNLTVGLCLGISFCLLGAMMLLGEWEWAQRAKRLKGALFVIAGISCIVFTLAAARGFVMVYATAWTLFFVATAAGSVAYLFDLYEWLRHLRKAP